MSDLIVERLEGGHVVVTLNRPQTLNAMALSMMDELYDVLVELNRTPEVRTVVVTSAKDRVFCAGANIRMLAASSHPFKVHFCKFTNETRLAIEDASENSGIRFIAALNGVCAGGGYELALACDDIVLVEDSSSAVSLPEVPLLAVLPGTGGLTRLVDKRGVRRDRAVRPFELAQGRRPGGAFTASVDGENTRRPLHHHVASVGERLADQRDAP